MHSLRLSDLPKVLFTYTDAQGKMTALVPNNRLAELSHLYWYRFPATLFAPQTANRVRVALFNTVLSGVTGQPGPFAHQVRRRRGHRGVWFLHVELTDAGRLLVLDKYRYASLEEIGTADLLTRPWLVNRLSDDLKAALKIVGLLP